MPAASTSKLSVVLLIAALCSNVQEELQQHKEGTFPRMAVPHLWIKQSQSSSPLMCRRSCSC